MATQKIETGLIADSAVTTAKIADNSVTGAKIAAASLDDQVKGISSSADAVAITIDSSENVGIGSTSPAFETGKGLEIRNSGGNGAHLKLTDNASGTGATQGFDLYMFNSQGYIENYENAPIIFRQNGGESARFDSSGNLGLGTNSPNSYSGQTALTINSTGVARLDLDISNTRQGYVLAESGYLGIFADSGNTLRLGAGGDEDIRILASGYVGIGTQNPATALEVNNLSAGDTVATFEGNYGAGGDVQLVRYERSGGAVYGAISYKDATTDMEFGNISSHNLSFTTGNTRRMTIMTNGGVEVGDGTNYGYVKVINDSAVVQYLDRRGTDGAVLEIRHADSKDGQINTLSGRMAIGSDDTGIFFDSTRDCISPFTMTGNDGRGDLIDIGRSGVKFKDLYLSGGIQFDSRTNKLDDYEEGTWTPTLANAYNITSLTLSEAGRYTKIGNLVHLEFQVSGSFTNAAVESRFSFTLPFNSATTSSRATGMFSHHLTTFSNGRFNNGQIFSGTNSDTAQWVYISTNQLSGTGSFTGRGTVTYVSA